MALNIVQGAVVLPAALLFFLLALLTALLKALYHLLRRPLAAVSVTLNWAVNPLDKLADYLTE